MSDGKMRIDLSSNLDQDLNDLFKNVSAAADEVKSRKEAERAKQAHEASKAKSRKIQMMLVALGAVVILLVSYFIVFAGPGSQEMASTTKKSVSTTAQAPPVAVPRPSSTPSAPSAPSPSSSTVGQDSQVVVHPPDEYEQPYEPGM